MFCLRFSRRDSDALDAQTEAIQGMAAPKVKEKLLLKKRFYFLINRVTYVTACGGKSLSLDRQANVSSTEGSENCFSTTSLVKGK